MRFGLKLIVIVAGLGTLFTTGGIAMSNAQKTIDTIVLSCPDAVQFQTELCAAMEAVLRVAAPDKAIRQGTDASGATELAVSLRVPQMSKDMLQAYLEWRTRSGAVEQGPKAELSVMDATLKPSMFDRFLSDLLNLSHLPIN